MKCVKISFHKNDLFVGNKIVVKTSTVAITDNSNVHCFDLYLMYIYLRNLLRQKEAHCIQYVQADTLFFACC